MEHRNGVLGNGALGGLFGETKRELDRCLRKAVVGLLAASAGCTLHCIEFPDCVSD